MIFWELEKYLFGRTNFETTKPETGCHYYDKHSCKLQKLFVEFEIRCRKMYLL